MNDEVISLFLRDCFGLITIAMTTFEQTGYPNLLISNHSPP